MVPNSPTSKLEHQLELVRKLPKDKQKAISTVLDLALQNVADASVLNTPWNK